MAVKNLISVIVPVYNTEKYLAKCVNSLIAQTYDNIEIVIVDNGSNDASPQICDEYAQKYENIKVIHQENHGVSGSRNTGIRNASGEYLAFVDSDDEIDSGMIEYLYQNIQGADMSCCGYIKCGEEGELLETKNTKILTKTIKSKTFLNILFGMSRREYQGYIWNKLFKGSIIRENNLEFDETINYNEDRLFLCSYLVHTKKCTYSDRQLYFYRQRADSAMGKLEKAFDEAVLTELKAYEKMEKLLEKHPFIKIAMRVQEQISAKKLLKKSKGHEQANEYIKDFMKNRNYTLGKAVVFAAKFTDTFRW